MAQSPKTENPSQSNDANPNNNTKQIISIDSPHNTVHSEYHNDRGDQKKKSKFEWGTFIIAIIALFVSFGVAYFSRQQVGIMKDTEIRQLRAYLNIIQDGWQEFDGKYPFGMGIKIINYGQTPAKEVRIYGNVKILPFPLPSQYSFEYSKKDSVYCGICFPNITDSTATKGCIVAKRMYTPEEIIQITSIKSIFRIYVSGHIIYRDIFNIKRNTFFCYYLNPETIKRRSNGTIKTFIWGITEEHNSFD